MNSPIAREQNQLKIKRDDYSIERCEIDVVVATLSLHLSFVRARLVQSSSDAISLFPFKEECKRTSQTETSLIV